jgi:hypothetical protein
MEIDLARYLARAAFRSSRELGDLIPFLKTRLGAEEYQGYAKAIASAVAVIQIDLLNKLMLDHPALKAEIENSIAKYDRYL